MLYITINDFRVDVEVKESKINISFYLLGKLIRKQINKADEIKRKYNIGSDKDLEKRISESIDILQDSFKGVNIIVSEIF